MCFPSGPLPPPASSRGLPFSPASACRSLAQYTRLQSWPAPGEEYGKAAGRNTAAASDTAPDLAAASLAAVEDGQPPRAAEQSDQQSIAALRDSDQRSRTAAAWAVPLWFLAQYTFTTSLVYTSVTSNTILSTASGLFTYGLSVTFLEEVFTWNKLGMIVCCMSGEGGREHIPPVGSGLILHGCIHFGRIVFYGRVWA